MKYIVFFFFLWISVTVNAQVENSVNVSRQKLTDEQKHYQFDTSATKWYKLRHFSSGINAGYSIGFYPYSNNIYLGLSSTFCSRGEVYAVNIDNSAVYNTHKDKWFYENTLSYRFPCFWTVSYTSSFVIDKSKLNYNYGIGVNLDEGLYSVGGYYSIKNTHNLNSKIGVKVLIRPFYILRMINNP